MFFLVHRCRKILTTIVSTFTSYYVNLWASHFPEKILSSPMPSFDGRVVQYPSAKNLRDYVSWRQVDCTSARERYTPSIKAHIYFIILGHVNNLYNTTFWALRQHGSTAVRAEEELKVRMLILFNHHQGSGELLEPVNP